MNMTKLSERAMLVTLHLSTYAGIKADKEVTAAAHAQFNAEGDAGRYGKKLIASRFLRDVNAAHNNARAAHRMLTLPWEDDGTRILTTQGYLPYQAKMKKARDEVQVAVKAFVAGLPDYITEAKQRLGGMFNAEDYPTQTELEAKFGFDIEIKSLPEAADFRAQLSDQQVKSITKDIDQRAKQRVTNAMNHVYERIVEMVEQLSTKLKDYQPAADANKANGNFRNSTLYCIFEFASEMMPILNITNDNRIEKLRVELMNDLQEYSPEILRVDVKARQETISKADEIIKRVRAYMQ
jgi:hypothetical protein